MKSHSVQYSHPNSKTSCHAANESSLHFPNLKAAPDGSFVAQHVPKCIAACLAAMHFGLSRELVLFGAGTVMTQSDIFCRLDVIVPVHKGQNLCRMHGTRSVKDTAPDLGHRMTNPYSICLL